MRRAILAPMDFRKVLNDALTAELGPPEKREVPAARWLAERIHRRWVTGKSPNGIPVDTAEQTILHFLAGRRDTFPLPALEAAFDALRLKVSRSVR